MHIKTDMHSPSPFPVHAGRAEGGADDINVALTSILARDNFAKDSTE